MFRCSCPSGWFPGRAAERDPCPRSRILFPAWLIPARRACTGSGLPRDFGFPGRRGRTGSEGFGKVPREIQCPCLALAVPRTLKEEGKEQHSRPLSLQQASRPAKRHRRHPRQQLPRLPARRRSRPWRPRRVAAVMQFRRPGGMYSVRAGPNSRSLSLPPGVAARTSDPCTSRECGE